MFMSIISDFFSIMFPRTCLNCHQPLSSKELFMCVKCKLDLPITQDMYHADNDLLQKFVYEPKIVSACSFLHFTQGGIAQKLLHQLKYHRQREIGIVLGKWFAEMHGKWPVDIVVPVPIHKSKRRKRGYNQSTMIANGIGATLELPIREGLIKRLVPTASQTGKTRLGRWSNMQNVYGTSAVALDGASVLVVDDVITTGATIGMLCDRLVEAGASAIHLACLARA